MSGCGAGLEGRRGWGGFRGTAEQLGTVSGRAGEARSVFSHGDPAKEKGEKLLFIERLVCKRA